MAGSDSSSSESSCCAEGKTEWASIYIGCGLTFMAASQFTLYFSSLYPFMKLLDSSTTVTFFGIVIASYSLSQSVASPLLGWWSNRIRRLKPSLYVCTLFMFVGNFLYFCVELFPSHHKYILLIARFICGVGDSAIAFLKAYAASASSPMDRSKAIAFVTGGVALGTVFGPAFQVMFSWIGYPGWEISPGIGISMYNAPALFACTTNVISMVLLFWRFKESFVGVIDNGSNSNCENADEPDFKIPPYDRFAAIACYCLRFTQIFVITNLETIGTSLSMAMFAWNHVQVVFYGSLAHVGMGIFSFMIYAIYIVTNLGRRVNERLVCFAALAVLLLFHCLTFSWPFLPDNVVIDYSTKASNTSNQTHIGCNIEESPWCDSLKKVNPYWYYLLFIFCIGIAWPNMNVTMNTLFSNIIGPRLQGTQQGILQMSAGVARMVGPILVGIFYTHWGPRMVWILEAVVVGLMMIFWMLCYRRLVPLKFDLNVSPTITTISLCATPPEQRKSGPIFIEENVVISNGFPDQINEYYLNVIERY
ncbi:major facilitator superfamily domain-containing protein [Ditylenchus destructor]|uniref:Major facilitator superfamily domain-containing protein n=1 Tax=Ditylenchus destructor TaxID=166010 RepID=A0AAD4RBH6_9BILA|nr:major facilitator superfamily domain-containing protein [Ditylenchus destructor]